MPSSGGRGSDLMRSYALLVLPAAWVQGSSQPFAALLVPNLTSHSPWTGGGATRSRRLGLTGHRLRVTAPKSVPSSGAVAALSSSGSEWISAVAFHAATTGSTAARLLTDAAARRVSTSSTRNALTSSCGRNRTHGNTSARDSSSRRAPSSFFTRQENRRLGMLTASASASVPGADSTVRDSP